MNGISQSKLVIIVRESSCKIFSKFSCNSKLMIVFESLSKTKNLPSKSSLCQEGR